MKLRVAWVVGFLTGVLLAGCGKDPATIHGTALYVVAYFKTSGYDIRSLYFTGQTPRGNDLFDATYRPMTPASTSLASPQRVRVYLGNELKGDKVTVSLYAVDKDGELVQFGFKSAVVEEGREVEVKIEMQPFFIPESDAGFVDGGEYVDSGFFDAGTIDAGRLQDGGTLPCACDGGCCFPGASTCFVPAAAVIDAGSDVAPLIYTFNVCGPPGSVCSLALCETSRTNTCHNGACSCGKQGLCQPGTRCTTNGSGQSSCVCDFLSQCQGCCGLNGTTCFNNGGNFRLSQIACGASGLQCQACGGSVTGSNPTCNLSTTGPAPVEQPGVCSSSLSCTSITCGAANQCCSENKCVTAGYPRCRKPKANVCIACDLLRTDSCSATVGCTCGNEGTTCNAGQYCDRNLAIPKCRAF